MVTIAFPRRLSLLLAPGLVAVGILASSVNAGAYGNFTGSVHFTSSGSMYACDVDYCIFASTYESAYAKWRSAAYCPRNYCYWNVSPIQLEDYLYDPNLTFAAFFGPFTWYRSIDLWDLRQSRVTWGVTAPYGTGLCWQVFYDYQNYDAHSGCNSWSHTLAYEGYPAGYGNYHASVYPDPSAYGGFAGSSGLVPLW